MRAAVLRKGGFVVEDLINPILEKLGQGAILRVVGCGLCGSDIVKVRTGLAKVGAILGHEVVGEIVDINVPSNFEIGDKVALGHHVPCFNCSYCWSENYSMCEHFKRTNIIPGGFCEYIFVSKEHLDNTVFRVDETLSDVEASFLEPLACCIRAVKRAKLRDNSKSLVVGLGSIGLLMGQAIKATGNKFYGCDLIPERIEFARQYGFEHTFETSDEEKFLKEVKEQTGIGFDTIFLTAGATKAVDLALKSIRNGGTIVVFSSIKSNEGFPNNHIYYKELTVLGSYSPSPMDLDDSMYLIRSKKVKVAGISTEYTLDKLNNAIIDTLSNRIMKAYIKL